MNRLSQLILLALVLMSTWTVRAGAAESLLSNGDLQTVPADTHWPADWGKAEHITFETEGDDRFLRLKSAEAGKTVLAYRQIALPQPVPAALEIKVRVRYQDVKPGEKAWFDARFMGNFKDTAGKLLKPAPTLPAYKGTSTGWVEQAVVIKVPRNAHTFEIMPALFQVNTGTFDVARCQVFAATADQLPKPPPIVPSTAMPLPNPVTMPELKVVGNEVHTPDGKPIWLQGLSLDSMQWSQTGDKLQQSIPVAIDQWKSNIIRLAVTDDFWFGRHKQQVSDKSGLEYRKRVDEVILAANARGAYVVIDLHRFGAPMPPHAEFWKDVATRYKDQPGVLFELFNEAHGIPWHVWRDGGSLKDPKNQHKDQNVAENDEKVEGEVSIGMQALVNTVRETGAKNLIIAGGLDWGYDLSGVINGFALDDKGGNGIMYSSHIYPWKSKWQKNTLDAAAKYPVYIGEVGCPEKWEDFSFIPVNERSEKLGPGCTWPADMLGMIQKNKLHWTGFSFHPKCGPPVILDWEYNPTPYWGAYVKRALAGEQFQMERMR